MDNSRNVRSEIANTITKKRDRDSKSNHLVHDEHNKEKESNYSRNTTTSSPVSETFFFTDLTRNDEVLNLPPNTPAFPKDKEIDYNCISYLTSRRKPDVYAGTEVITAKQYRVINVSSNKDDVSKVLKNADKEEMQTMVDGEYQSSSSEEINNDYEEMKKKDYRYFDVSNITIKCYNCDEVGHISKNCPSEQVIICLRCQQKGHLSQDCPNIKCFRCNQIGHKSYECKIRNKDIIKCGNCENIGHEEEDCLINPPRIKKKLIKSKTCYFCNKEGHVMCHLKQKDFVIEDYHSEDVELTETEDEKYVSEDEFHAIISKNKKKSEPKSNSIKRKRKRIFNKLDNRDIKNTIFCPKCADMHTVENCNVQSKFNSFDKLRQHHSRNLWRSDRNDRDEERNASRNSYNKSFK
jgi:hypothetical protein